MKKITKMVILRANETMSSSKIHKYSVVLRRTEVKGMYLVVRSEMKMFPEGKKIVIAEDR